MSDYAPRAIVALLLLSLSWSCARRVQPDARKAGPTNGDRAASPELDFSEQPFYIPNDTLSLTFDDGPLPPFTGAILDILKKHRAHATFFVNTDNNGNNVDGTPATQDLVRRIVDEGHRLGNHTVHHKSLKTLTPDQIEAEITGVETSVRSILGVRAAPLTLLRAPYGEPYQDYFNNHGDPAGATYPLVSSVVARHAIHIGWNIETDDWRCSTGEPSANASCVYDHFVHGVKTVGAPGAQWGIVLMHCINPQTVAALPRVLDYIEANHFKLVSVEDVVRMRFGKSSAEVVPHQ